MIFEEGKLDKETLERLQRYGILLGKNTSTLNKERALVLVGEAMLDNFVKEFVSLWKNEIFADCLLRNIEATEQEKEAVFGIEHPTVKKCNYSKTTPGCRQNIGSQSYSNDCKEVNDKMDAETKKLLNNYLELYTEIFKKVDNETAATAIMTEICKDKRVEQMKKERETKNNNDEVTLRQKKCMQNLGIEFPDDITRKEASVLIQEELGKLNNGGE